MIRALQDIYDEFARTYEDQRGLFDMSEIFETFHHSLGIEKGHLLDLGCGAGEPIPRMFIDKGWRVSGVDFSQRMLDMAQKFVPEMKTYLSDMRNIDFASGSFDAVTAVYSLFHIPRKDHRLLFKKIHAWLSPQGKFLFTYATEKYTGSPEFDGHKEFMGHKLYYSHTTPEKLYAELKSCRFKIESEITRDIGNEAFLWVTAVSDSFP
jgi:cyclopropane fatty-acyl-phospholipid synthase-like methyltransferase